MNFSMFLRFCNIFKRTGGEKVLSHSDSELMTTKKTHLRGSFCASFSVFFYRFNNKIRVFFFLLALILQTNANF